MSMSGYTLNHRQVYHIGDMEPEYFCSLKTRTGSPVMYSEIIKTHNASKPFTDVDFPTTQESVGNIRMDSANAAHNYPLWDKKYKWFRAADAVVKACGAKSCTFAHAGLNSPSNVFSGQDVRQGLLGDCWFLACTSAISSKPGLIDFVCPSDNNHNNGSGAYHFRICNFGLWIDVVVDDYIACAELFGPGGGWNIVASIPPITNGVAEIWPILLEKAYAKLNGSYANIEANTSLTGLEDLSGGVGERNVIGSMSTSALNDKINTVINLGSFVTISAIGPKSGLSAEDFKKAGIHFPHTYSMTRMVEVTVKGVDVPLLLLRNPWGNSEWTGAWSDSSPEWDSVDRKDDFVRLTVDNDGEFWMCLDDVVKYFASVEICYWDPDPNPDKNSPVTVKYHYGEWSVDREQAGGVQNPWKNPQYKVVVPDIGDGTGRLFLNLQIKGAISELNVTTSFLVLLYNVADDSPEPPYDVDFFSKPTTTLFKPGGRTSTSGDTYFRFTSNRRTSTGFRLLPGTYVIIPVTKLAGIEEKFLLKILQQKKFECDQE